MLRGQGEREWLGPNEAFQTREALLLPRWAGREGWRALIEGRRATATCVREALSIVACLGGRELQRLQGPGLLLRIRGLLPTKSLTALCKVLPIDSMTGRDGECLART